MIDAEKECELVQKFILDEMSASSALLSDSTEPKGQWPYIHVYRILAYIEHYNLTLVHLAQFSFKLCCPGPPPDTRDTGTFEAFIQVALIGSMNE